MLFVKLKEIVSKKFIRGSRVLQIFERFFGYLMVLEGFWGSGRVLGFSGVLEGFWKGSGVLRFWGSGFLGQGFWGPEH